MESFFKSVVLGLLLSGMPNSVFAAEQNTETTSGDVELSIYQFDQQKYSHIFDGDEENKQSTMVSFRTVASPYIELDPIVYGAPEDHPGKIAIQKLGTDQLKFRVSGTVFDMITDSIPSDKRLEKKVIIMADSLYGKVSAGAPIISIDREFQITQTPHPAQTYFDENPDIEEVLRPYPFAGRFESEEIIIDINTFSTQSIVLMTNNATNELGFATIDLEYEVDAANSDYELSVDVRDNSEFSVHPMLLHIHDPAVTEENIHNARVIVNSKEMGLRYIDGQLQLDRPLYGIFKAPIGGAPNIVQVHAQPGSFFIEYKDKTLELKWDWVN